MVMVGSSGFVCNYFAGKVFVGRSDITSTVRPLSLPCALSTRLRLTLPSASSTDRIFRRWNSRRTVRQVHQGIRFRGHGELRRNEPETRSGSLTEAFPLRSRTHRSSAFCSSSPPVFRTEVFCEFPTLTFAIEPNADTPRPLSFQPIRLRVYIRRHRRLLQWIRSRQAARLGCHWSHVRLLLSLYLVFRRVSRTDLGPSLLSTSVGLFVSAAVVNMIGGGRRRGANLSSF